MSTDVEMVIKRLLLGDSLPMRLLRSRIARVAATRVPVLIQGATGCGKELVARAIHLASRRDGSFVAFNVCAISEAMFEDALFGHRRGAFTGAFADGQGLLAEGHRGTVFFDEIGGLGLQAQAKLLRAIETGAFRPVGGRHDEVSEFRVVSATNQPLRDLVAEQRFREDLLYRLSAFVVDVPSLAARPEDIATLARHFLGQSENARRVDLAPDAIEALERHPWPGNVRELKHVVECAAIFAANGVIRAGDVADAVPADCAEIARALNGKLGRRRLTQILDETGWDVRAAADALGVHRATIYRRLKRGQLSSPIPRDPASTVT